MANRSGPSFNSPALDRSAKGGHKGLLKDQLELERVRGKDGSTRVTIRAIEDTLSFDKGFYVFVRALQMLKSQNEGTLLVGLAGPSGSGKTAFSEKMASFMPGVAVICMDMYNDGGKVVDDNFDDPRLTDYDTLLANLEDIKEGRATQIPVYSFTQSKRIGTRTLEPPESRVVIIEGIYALSERLRPLLDLRVSITGGIHFDLIKRVMRDITRSGQAPEEIIQQITDTVFPMYKAFIEPSLQTAQLKITNNWSPFSGFMAPSYILKSRIVPTKEMALQELQALGPVTQRNDGDIYDIYLLPPNEDPETCQSWLRMRNKDGRYSLMFEEWVVEPPFVISPRIAFEVNVRVLGGLMALGYSIGTIMRRTSHIMALNADEIQIKFDDVEGLGSFCQLLGKDRAKVAALGSALGLDGTYIARSYIEQVQLEKLTTDFVTVTEEWKHRFTLNGESLLDQSGSPDNGRYYLGGGRGIAIPSTSAGSGSGAAALLPPLSASAPQKRSAPLAVVQAAEAASGEVGRKNSGSGSGSGLPHGLLHQQLTAAGAGPSTSAHINNHSNVSNDTKNNNGNGNSQNTSNNGGTPGSFSSVHSANSVSAHLPPFAPSSASGGPPNIGSLSSVSGINNPQLRLVQAAGQLGSRRGSETSIANLGAVNSVTGFNSPHQHPASGNGGGNGHSGSFVSHQQVGGHGGGGGNQQQVHGLTRNERSSSAMSLNGLNALYERIDGIGGAVERFGGVQVQLDAMVEQYTQTNEQLRALGAATSSLAARIAALLPSEPQAAGGPVTYQSPGVTGSALWAEYLLLAATGLAAGVALGLLAVAAGSRGKGR